MDITNVFRASVKTVKLRNKNLLVVQKPDQQRDYNGFDFTTGKRKCPFSAQSREIVKDTTELRDFLCKNRRAYLNLNNLWSGCGMTDLERDKIESETEVVIKATGQLLSNLTKSLMIDHRGSSQLYDHRKAILEIVSSYLKAVCKIYSEQRAVRVKKASDMKRLSRLESLVRTSKFHKASSEDRKLEGSSDQSQFTEESGLRRRRNRHEEPMKSDLEIQPRSGFLFSEDDVGEMELSNEERQQLTKENEQLYHSMNAMVDEIQQLEGKVVEISKLQEVFSEKVLDQEGDIYRINEVAIHTTENIKSGNEQIREAMKKRASMRVYILFFLIVLSFTLLFLDWYNS